MDSEPDTRQWVVMIAIVVFIVAGAAGGLDAALLVVLVAGLSWFYYWLFKAISMARKQHKAERSVHRSR